MLFHTLKTALRNILRNRYHTLITITGLSVGMTVSIMILMFVWDDLRFDRFHKNADRIYRVVREVPDWGITIALNPLPMAKALQTDLPEVEKAASFTRFVKTYIRYDGQGAKEGPVCFTESDFFEIFSFEFLRGSAEEVFAAPYSMAITQKMAHKIFNREDPIGKSIFVRSIGNVKVQAIIKTPKRSHIQLGLVLPLSLYPRSGYVGNWHNSNFTTYVMLHEGSSWTEFQRKHASYLDKIFGIKAKHRILFQPLRHVYLKSNFAYDFMKAPYNIYLHYLLVLIAVSILVIACFNYIIIETARGVKRSTEVAVRKSFGGTNYQMIWQFLSEAVCLSVLAFLLAIMMVEIFLPSFNRWTEIKELSLYDSEHWGLLLAMAISAIVIGMAAGSYPAYLLAALKPTEGLGQMQHGGPVRPYLRKFLVAFQFFIAIALIISALTILEQREFFITKRPGYSPKNVVFFDLTGRVQQNYDAFKAQLLTHPKIISVTAARDLPTWGGPSTLLNNWQDKTTSEDFLIYHAPVDPDFIETMGIQLVAGKSFAMDPTGEGLILNQEAVRQMKLTEPIGAWVSGWQHRGAIIGVVEDYNFNNLREKVAPLILNVDRTQLRVGYIRISPEDMDEAIKAIELVWNTVEPDYPFIHHHLSGTIENLYTLEKKVGELFFASASLTLLLSCIGLYGLTSYICEQRTKEIAIRKAYGATSAVIFRHMISEFFKLAVTANALAWPVTYISLSIWLNKLAYHIEVNIYPFASAAITSMIAVLAAVSIKTVRSASANPIDALRYE